MKEGRRKLGNLWIWIGVALAIGALAGAGATAALISPAPSPQKTFTIVAYHWGFALYDEDGNEIAQIEVDQGTIVTLLIIGAEALSHEIHEQYEERTIEAWADNPDFGGKNATEIHDEIEAAEAAGLEEHSVRIADYDIDVVTDVESPAPKRLTFVADKIGVFDIECNAFCGWGHQYMKLEGGFVVT